MAVKEPWQRNPDFWPITLRYPLLFPSKRAWWRAITEKPGVEYATDEEVARLALEERFADQH